MESTVDFPTLQLNAFFRLPQFTCRPDQIFAIGVSGSVAHIHLHNAEKPIVTPAGKLSLEEVTNLWVQALHAQETLSVTMHKVYQDQTEFTPFPGNPDPETNSNDALNDLSRL